MRPLLPSRPSAHDHTRWLIPLLAGISLIVFFRIRLLPLTTQEDVSSGEATLFFLIPATVLLCAALALIQLCRCLHRYWRDYRFTHGHPNKVESRVLALTEERRRTVAHAQAVAIDLGGPQSLSLSRPWDLNIPTDERVLFDGLSSYSRYYGTDVSYTQTSGFFYGSPLFVVAGLGLNAAANRSSRNSAIRISAQQWREHQVTRHLVTNERILVHRADGQWLSFYFSGTTATYPHLEAETLFLEFPETSPLRIQGPASAVASVVAIWHAHGNNGLLHHPDLDPLRKPPISGTDFKKPIK